MQPGGSTSGNSNIRVFVRWHEQVIFAGEELKCTITFKNVARPAGSASSSSSSSSSSALSMPTTATLRPGPPQSSQFPPSPSRLPNAAADHHRGGGARQPSPLQPGRGKPGPGLAPPPPSARGHRSALSLSVPSAASRARTGSVSWSPLPSGVVQGEQQTGGSSAAGRESGGAGAGGGGGVGGGANGRGHGHKRSVSIVSIGSLSTVDDGQGSSTSTASAKPQRARGHARASSLQILPRGGLLNGPLSATHPRIPASQSSPLFHASYPPDRSINGRRPGTVTAPQTPRVDFPRHSPATPSALADFRFPMSPSPATAGAVDWASDEDPTSPTSGGLPSRSRDPVPTINEQTVASAARVLSTMSIAGTPRSSGEFYSLSNNSSETLASEYVTQQPLRSQQSRSPHSRMGSSLAPGPSRLPESLMMGYAQVQGSFTLDGSLINLGPFEAVKRKAVVGGQGGGVVGLETPKRDSGLLRGFGWGNITSSIGELLGGGELSTIKEMRGIANSKAIPLLSTPQSILFVDLQLGPGESRSYEYSFKLPRGLPPTHRGKAMKISYSLIIGTQRPGGAKEKRIKSVDVPFRVLGSVNSHGEILGHDLMSPYILLRDQARVQAVNYDDNSNSNSNTNNTNSNNTTTTNNNKNNSSDKTRTAKNKPASSSATSSMSSFFSYVDELLARPSQDASHGALLSPNGLTARSPTSSRRASVLSVSDHGFLAPPTAKEAIDLAILRSNLAGAGDGYHAAQSPNRFEIARNGRRVGVVMLARPAYRLGETVTCVVDFGGAEVPCYAVHAALETAERVVDGSLALRSEASVARVTRKVWAGASEATLFARRWVFHAAVPAHATPEFITSGVALDWKVRLEFVVPVQAPQHQHQHRPQPQPQGQDGDGGDEDEDDGDGDGTGEGGGEEKRTKWGSKQAVQQQQQPHPLLEEISRDDRGGLILVGVENLVCESFEVAVPLRVYGATCNGLEKLERDDAMAEGLPV
ncbi:hypothetical protein MYCTH_2312763 [Thermothelomyces thermophilus ATCC 42464]|uniref:Rgp1-domain-containing protein n=1 Tax=Thermothelomyces thermophilus (strain ATCC 42464 / BCRC 31852 / DSM 1799) TaxID=573729 RepID=G2QN74_THET4|nr:uncharacterized protein MYCTH_2312763 [Thermothelomyces thermophilus ATCC 42464]AEO61947.1 hypothetical protein MYCTH_2312763 [Thermothelomyces thermophilus ATCC 42464]